MNVVLILSLWFSEESLEVFFITTKLPQEEVTFPVLPQAKQTWGLQFLAIPRGSCNFPSHWAAAEPSPVYHPALEKHDKIGHNIPD